MDDHCFRLEIWAFNIYEIASALTEGWKRYAFVVTAAIYQLFPMMNTDRLDFFRMCKDNWMPYQLELLFNRVLLKTAIFITFIIIKISINFLIFLNVLFVLLDLVDWYFLFYLFKVATMNYNVIFQTCVFVVNYVRLFLLQILLTIIKIPNIIPNLDKIVKQCTLISSKH